MRNIDKLKQLNSTDLAYMLCIDNEGNYRGCCPICQRFIEDNCDDNCIKGVEDWLNIED